MASVATYARPERRLARPSPAAIALAVLALHAIAFATLCPIGLRPHLADANAERFFAYVALGALAARAGGRRALAVTALVVLAAVALEGAQALIPGRHATAPDAMVKALGGVMGCAAVQMRFPLRRLVARATALAARPRPASAAER